MEIVPDRSLSEQNQTRGARYMGSPKRHDRQREIISPPRGQDGIAANQFWDWGL